MTALSERVIARQPGHLKIKEAISPTLNPLCPSLSPTRPASFHSSSVPALLFPNPPLFPSNSLPLCPNPISSNSLPLCLFHPPLFFFSKSSLSLLHYLQLNSLSPSSPLSFLLSTCCPSLILSSFSPFEGRQQDLLLSGCVSVITRGFTQRAVAKSRGTKAITHSTTHRLLCHIKGERVIFQLQFAV